MNQTVASPLPDAGRYEQIERPLIDRIMRLAARTPLGSDSAAMAVLLAAIRIRREAQCSYEEIAKWLARMADDVAQLRDEAQLVE